MQKITRRKLAEYVADQLYAGAGTKQLVNQTVAYLREENQLNQWELLVRDIEDMLARKYDVVTTHISSAHQLDSDTRKQLADFIQKAEQAKTVIVADEIVDEQLIGGVVVQTPSHVFDSSIQSKLKHLVATTKG